MRHGMMHPEVFKNKMRTIPESSTTKAANGNLHSSNLSRTAGSLEKIRARLLGMNLRADSKIDPMVQGIPNR